MGGATLIIREYRHLTPAETILCALLTLLLLVAWLTGTLDLAVWVAWKVGGGDRECLQGKETLRCSSSR